MFTQNYINYMKGYFMDSGVQGTTNEFYFNDTLNTKRRAYGPHCRAMGIGAWMRTGRCRMYNAEKQSSADATYPGIYFGTGSTPATKEDYALESPISSGLTITNPGAIVERDLISGKYEYISGLVIRNDTYENINIQEIGLFLPMATGSSAHYLVLAERTVLDTPVTIPVGEARFIEYRVAINQPV